MPDLKPRTTALPGDLCEEIRSCLRRHLSRVNAELVLRRGAGSCGVLPEALTLGHLTVFLESVERAMAVYLDGSRLDEARRGLRALLSRMGTRVPSLPRAARVPTPALPMHPVERTAARSGRLRGRACSLPALEPIELPVVVDADLEAVRQEALRFGRAVGLGQVDTVKVATVVSELARNILQYAGRGRIRLAPAGDARPGLRLVAMDQGPGIAEIETILAGGYRSRTGMGLGIFGSKKLMDSFEVETSPGRGTTITAEKHA